MEEFIFSIDSPKCRTCKFYDDCKNKRKVMCSFIPLKYLSQFSCNASMPLTKPIKAKHDFREIKIDDMEYTVDLEEIKKNIEKELNCPFLQSGA